MPNWTKEQEKAIYEPSGKKNILVSAAAGSGKTAVLVERIVNLITNSENPFPIDSILVATFTEAAATEMKERIINRINKSYREALENGDIAQSKYLKEQMHLTAGADINTIDAFCLRVVKNNFHVLGIDPNFSIMDTNEDKMLIDDTLTDLFAALYETENEENKNRFQHLVTTYASNRDDEGLKKVIRKLYNFIQSFPDPIKWLYDKAAMYDNNMSQSVWFKEIFLSVHKENILKHHGEFWDKLIKEMIGIVKKVYPDTDTSVPPVCIPECEQYWGKMWEYICICADSVKALKSAESFDEVGSAYDTYIAKTKLGTAVRAYKKAESPIEEWQYYSNKYNSMREDLLSSTSYLPNGTAEQFNKYVHSEELKQTIDDIVWITVLFSELYENAKAKKNVKTFSDIEHLAYRLFSENENIRNEYSLKYNEILIDEYQDTNGLQDSIFTLISRDNKNMFMVGDLKQSIYRFRGGDPTIFKKKYSLDSDEIEIIHLSQNFRSRMQVIDSINDVFRFNMSQDVGDVDYNDTAALQREESRECYINTAENARNDYKSEFYCIGKSKDSKESSSDYLEAVTVANRIKELVDNHFKVYDGNGKYRDLKYSDIVVLMRSTKVNGELLQEILESNNIPSFLQKEEYFEKREIKLMLTLISLINNHIQDIPLVSVMRSPIGNFTENELSKIRLENKASSFYNAVKYYKSSCDDLTKEEQKLSKKCKSFLKDLDRWRGYVKMKSISALIWTLYEETGFYDFMGALEGGDEAQANLKLLYERARKYEESGFKGIFNFIRYIERIEKRNEDLSGAQLINENHNVVRIMTIHKSKGLEFPVVFIMRTTKNMLASKPTEEHRIQLHKDLGIGIDYINYENLYLKKLMFTKYIKRQNQSETLSEELRLLYVAMTRAKEKLIIVSSDKYKDENEFNQKIQEAVYNAKTMPKYIIASNAKKYSDWLIPSIGISLNHWNFIPRFLTKTTVSDVIKEKQETIKVKNIDEMREKVQKLLEFHYERPQSGNIPTKTSVTAIKEMTEEELTRKSDIEYEPIYMMQKPDFMRTEKLGTQIGTAHHQLMAFFDIEKIKTLTENNYADFVASELVRVTNDGQIDSNVVSDKNIADMICKNVTSFWKSDMGKEVLSAKKVYRESPFEISIPAYEYDNTLPDEYRNEQIILQGIIDLYFEDKNGDIILVDYKTDKCTSEAEQLAVAKKYEKQLILYARAMEKILKKSVKDKYLYLFSPQSVVKLD